MRNTRWKWLLAALVASVGAACSTILGLEPPPAPDAGMTGGHAGGDAGGDAGVDAEVDAQPSPVCAPLDAGDGGTYFALTPVTVDDSGTGGWDWFDTGVLAAADPIQFSGGTLDTHGHVYFAGHGGFVVQYDTQADGGFEQPASWAFFNTGFAPLSVLGGFSGALCDGRYVYFIPDTVGVTQSRMARFDSMGTFKDPTSWAVFELSTLSVDGGPATSGFFGGTFDGRYLYLVPHNDGTPDGRVVRYDTTAPDAGPADAGDAGDAGDGSDFGVLTRWATFDVATVNPAATGFSGAAFDGTAIYLAPNANGGGVNGGSSAITARLDLAAGFTKGWSTFDLTSVNGEAYDFEGAGFDGRYVYLAPRGHGVVVRFDTSGKFGSIPAWSAYDLTHVAHSPPDASSTSVDYAGVAFDGRFVYFLPIGLAPVARYDTLSPFTADCAWSTADLSQVDLSQIDGGVVVPQNFNGAVFDGQYLYLIPNTNGLFARFQARTPASPPALPGFYGSFW